MDKGNTRKPLANQPTLVTSQPSRLSLSHSYVLIVVGLAFVLFHT